jgi:hypothetical protein
MFWSGGRRGIGKRCCDRESCKTPNRIVNISDQQDLCLPHEAFNHQLKCRHVSLALRHALEEMPAKTLLDCCDNAVNSINRTKETVSRWHLTFRGNNDSFPNPHVLSNKKPLPPLLDCYPELTNCIVRCAKQNLHELSAELLHSHLHETALTALLDQRRAELVDDNHAMEQLLGEH